MRKQEGVVSAKKESVGKQMLYGWHIMFHPFAGFWDLKYEKRGSIKSSTALYGLYVFSVLFSRLMTAYLYNSHSNEQLELIPEICFALIPYFLWIVSNWCVTSLMYGEGSFGDIYRATAYALTPTILVNLISVPLSWMITLEQQTFYALLTSIGTLWTLALIFCGLMITQQFSLGRSLLCTAIVIVGMLIIVFLALLVFYLVQQVLGFGMDVYNELYLRLNE